MQHNIYIYILIASVVATLIRVLPTTLIRKQITNRFIKSFLYYVPYVTLAVMTFPAIIEATNSPIAGHRPGILKRSTDLRMNTIQIRKTLNQSIKLRF